MSQSSLRAVTSLSALLRTESVIVYPSFTSSSTRIVTISGHFTGTTHWRHRTILFLHALTLTVGDEPFVTSAAGHRVTNHDFRAATRLADSLVLYVTLVVAANRFPKAEIAQYAGITGSSISQVARFAETSRLAVFRRLVRAVVECQY